MRQVKRVLLKSILFFICVIIFTMFFNPPEYRAQPSGTIKNSGTLVVLIVAGFRTGSTFLGELFNQNSEAFYLFEPFHQRTLWANRNKLSGVNRSSNVPWNISLPLKDPKNINTMRDMQIYYLEELIHKCTVYDGKYYYSTQTMKHAQCGTQQENLRRFKTSTCTEKTEEMMTHLCKTKDLIVPKLIRLRYIADLERFAAIEGFNLKIIHLLRDPRAVIKARTKFPKFYLNDLVEIPSHPLTVENVAAAAEDYCTREYDNLHYTNRYMPVWFQDKYLRVTHEEMSRDVQGTAGRVYKFIGRSVPEEIKHWANEIVSIRPENIQKNGPLNTYKNPLEVLDTWRTKMDERYIRAIEDKCQNYMKEMSYEKF